MSYKHTLAAILIATSTVPAIAGQDDFYAEDNSRVRLIPSSLTISEGVRLIYADYTEGNETKRMRFGFDGCAKGHGHYARFTNNDPLRVIGDITPWFPDGKTLADGIARRVCAMPDPRS